jgi:hypothetical protein
VIPFLRQENEPLVKNGEVFKDMIKSQFYPIFMGRNKR